MEEGRYDERGPEHDGDGFSGGSKGRQAEEVTRNQVSEEPVWGAAKRREITVTKSPSLVPLYT